MNIDDQRPTSDHLRPLSRRNK